MIAIQNDGPLILRSNYWDGPEAEAGKFLVSLNAGAFRLLLPPVAERYLTDMAAAKECLVSRGPWPAWRLPDAFEILFDDDTADPFSLHMSPQCFDRLPASTDIGWEWVLTVWTAPRLDKPRLALSRPCWYRVVPFIPCLKPKESR